MRSAIIIGGPQATVQTNFRAEVDRVNNRDAEKITVADVAFEKKRSHDVAWLIILLAILVGCYLFVTVFVKSLLRNFGI